MKKWSWLMVCLVLSSGSALAADTAFTNLLAQADMAARSGNVTESLTIYDGAQRDEAGNAEDLCVLSRRYCDLTYTAASKTIQKTLVERAKSCAQQAVKDDPTNATAHAALAVCYAKSCIYADIKDELTYSRLFKAEAERAIALDPGQDVAYYLLGRWNYGLASVGLVSRAYVRVVYGGLPRATYEDAALNFQKAVELAPNRIINHAGLAMAYEAIGKKNLAMAEWEKCCALAPLDPEDREARQDAERKLETLKQ
jgi:tetratricopeptide (TPR) repeat protein